MKLQNRLTKTWSEVNCAVFSLVLNVQHCSEYRGTFKLWQNDSWQPVGECQSQDLI